ncbi:hypothetical protein [Vibrio sp. MA40-2]|uniref:hypothetical protein n=1 Tax=Vibrio sp. MA40-2 TaxID=3391828 RepID=UPI0039A5264F
MISNEKTIPDPAKLASLRAKLATSLNPKCNEDKKVLSAFDELKHNSETKVFSIHMALLLKHDWERVKWECMPIYLKIWCFIKSVFLKIFANCCAKELEWKCSNYRELPEKDSIRVDS